MTHKAGQPIKAESAQTPRAYQIDDSAEGEAHSEEWIRDQLQLGLNAADAGEVVDLDADAIKGAGRLRMSQSM